MISSRTMTTTLLRPAIAGAVALAAMLAVATYTVVEAQDSTDADAAEVAEAANLQTAVELFEKVFAGDPTAVDAIGDVYIQHNPSLPNGPEALVAFASQYAGLDFPVYEVVRGFTQDEFVILHSRFRVDESFTPDPDGPGFAVVDIFRFEDGKIVEHWDVLQPAVPADQTASGNDMFGQVTGS